MFEEIEQDQMNRLPSETEECEFNSQPSYREMMHDRLEVTLDPDDPDDWKKLDQKAMKVLDEGMNDNIDFKHRKACADTVLEIQGRKGSKRAIESAPAQMVLPAEAITALLTGLKSFAGVKDAEDTRGKLVEGSTVFIGDHKE